MEYEIQEIEGIGPKYAEKFLAAGVVKTSDLFAKGWKASDRKLLARETGISTRSLARWVNQANLMRVKGVGGEYANLLYRLNTPTLLALSQEDATVLFSRSNNYLVIKLNVVRRKPSFKEIETWIEEAKHLVEQLDLPEEIIDDYTNVLKLDNIKFMVEDAIEIQNWQQLVNLGNLLRGQSFNKLLRLRNRISQPINETTLQIPSNVVEQLKDPTILETIRQTLENSAIPVDKIDNYLDELASGEFQIPQIEDTHSYIDFLQEDIQHTIFIGVLGFYLTLIGQLNSQKAIANESRFSAQNLYQGNFLTEDQEGVSAQLAEIHYSNIEEQLKALESRLNEIHRNIYGALVAENLDTLEEKTLVGISRLETIAEELEKIVLVSSKLAISSNSVHAMKSSIHASRIIEKMLVWYGTCLYYTAINNQEGHNPVLERELAQAKQLGYQSKLQRGEAKTVKELLDEPEKYSTISLEVVGEIIRLWDQETQIMTFALAENKNATAASEDKYILPLRIKDKPEGFLLPNRIPGLVIGNLVEQDGQPALEITPINIPELAKQSWFDHAIHLSRKWYDLFPENYCVITNKTLQSNDTALDMIQQHFGRRK